MAYAVDRLGWLQFQQLCTGLLELDGRLPSSVWAGTADACRRAHSQVPLGPPLSAIPLPEPVLVHCVWIRPGSSSMAVEAAISQLAGRHPEDIALARSYLLLSNVDADPDHLRLAILEPRLQVAAVGPQALSERIDALPELRLAMPSLLGLRALDGLIDPDVERRSSLDRRDAEALAEVFVPTRAYWRALEGLRRHRFAVLTGPPEMGKTAIARMVGLAQMTAGWEAHECTDPDALWRALDPGRRQIFIADDAFGSTEYRAVAGERWATSMERLLRTLDDHHWLIWTSRPAPLHAALRRLHRERGAERFPAPGRVLVDAGDLSVGEKTLILFRHAKAADLPEPVRLAVRHHGVAILADEHFTPERIRRLVGRLRAGETDVRRIAATELTTATEAMAVSYDTLSAEHRDLLLALLDAPPGPVAERDLLAALRRHHDGSLSTAPVELVDRLADHFLRVLT